MANNKKNEQLIKHANGQWELLEGQNTIENIDPLIKGDPRATPQTGAGKFYGDSKVNAAAQQAVGAVGSAVGGFFSSVANAVKGGTSASQAINAQGRSTNAAGGNVPANAGVSKDDTVHDRSSPEDKAHDVVETKIKALKDKLSELKSAKSKKRLKTHVKSAEKEPRSAKNKRQTKLNKADAGGAESGAKKNIAVIGGGTTKPRFSASPAATGRAKIRPLGETSSGKKLFSSPGHEAHKDFTAKDHEEASRKHLEIASDLETRGASPELIDSHREAHKSHWQSMLRAKEAENPLKSR
jgi:hypothetical protein